MLNRVLFPVQSFCLLLLRHGQLSHVERPGHAHSSSGRLSISQDYCNKLSVTFWHMAHAPHRPRGSINEKDESDGFWYGGAWTRNGLRYVCVNTLKACARHTCTLYAQRFDAVSHSALFHFAKQKGRCAGVCRPDNSPPDRFWAIVNDTYQLAQRRFTAQDPVQAAVASLEAPAIGYPAASSTSFSN